MGGPAQVARSRLASFPCDAELVAIWAQRTWPDLVPAVAGRE